MAICSMLYVIALIITEGAGRGGHLQPSPGHGPKDVPGPPDYKDFSWTTPKGVVQVCAAVPYPTRFIAHPARCSC